MPDTLLPIPLGAQGISSKDDPLQSQRPNVLQNVVFNKTGRLDRRWGYKALPTNILGSSSMITSCKAIQAFGNELLLFDGATAYSFLQANQQWVTRGNLVSVIQSNNNIIRNTSQQLSPDLATLNGSTIYVWEDTRGGIRFSIVDETSGTLQIIDQPLYASMGNIIRPKALAYNGLLYVFFVNGGLLSYVTINPSNLAQLPTAPNTLINTLGSPGFFDACVSGSQLGIVFYDTKHAVNLLALNATSNVFQATVATLASTPTGALNVAPDSSGNFWVSFATSSNGTTANTACYSSTGSTVFGSTAAITQSTGPLVSLAGIVSGSTLTLYAEAYNSDLSPQCSDNVIYQNTISASLGAGSTSVYLRSVGLASKPFTYNGVVYLNLAHDSNLQSTYFTATAAGAIVSKVNAGNGGGAVQNSDYVLSECVSLSSGIFRYANLVKGTPNSVSGTILALLGVNSTELDFIDSNHFLSVDLNNDLYTVGGILSSYDGAQFLEHSFHLYPENISYTTSSSGGSLGSGVFNYCIVYAWDNNRGHTQYSTPSVPIAITFNSGNTNSVTLSIPTLRLTGKSNVRIEVYRTTANGIDLFLTTSPILPTYNNTSVDYITFTDTKSDTSLQSDNLMYTQPLATTNGNPILENISPPSCSLIATYADRVFLSGVDDPYTIWYSKIIAANRPAEFSDELTLHIDPDGGAITGLARFFTQLIIFKQYALFYIVGQGPTDTGDQNDFGDPVQIPSGGVGCSNPSSIVSTSFGLFFASQNGIYMLDNAGNVTYKGSPAEDFNSLTITSGNILPNQWVVWTTSQGTSIVYDYFYDQWMTWTNQPAIDSDRYFGNGNLHVFALTNGTVMQQTSSAFSDNGIPIPINYTSAWINPNVLQGYQLVVEAYVLGSYKGTHNLNVSVGFDFNPSFTQYETIQVDSVLGLAKYGITSPYGTDAFYGGGQAGQSLYMFRIDIIKKCTAVRFQITDTQTGTGNEGMNLSAVLLVIRTTNKGNRLPAIKQFA